MGVPTKFKIELQTVRFFVCMTDATEFMMNIKMLSKITLSVADETKFKLFFEKMRGVLKKVI